MKPFNAFSHSAGVVALSALAAVYPAGQAFAFDSGDAVLTGLAIGAVVALGNDRHHHRHHGGHYHRQTTYWREPRPYCPPRRSTVVTEIHRYEPPRHGWGQSWGNGAPDYGTPHNPWGGYGGARGYGSVSGYGSWPQGGYGHGHYQRRVEVNRW